MPSPISPRKYAPRSMATTPPNSSPPGICACAGFQSHADFVRYFSRCFRLALLSGHRHAYLRIIALSRVSAICLLADASSRASPQQHKLCLLIRSVPLFRLSAGQPLLFRVFTSNLNLLLAFRLAECHSLQS